MIATADEAALEVFAEFLELNVDRHGGDYLELLPRPLLAGFWGFICQPRLPWALSYALLAPLLPLLAFCWSEELLFDLLMAGRTVPTGISPASHMRFPALLYRFMNQEKQGSAQCLPHLNTFLKSAPPIRHCGFCFLDAACRAAARIPRLMLALPWPGAAHHGQESVHILRTVRPKIVRTK